MRIVYIFLFLLITACSTGREETFQEWKYSIRKNPGWMEKLKTKALEKNITLDSALNEEARRINNENPRR
jgi:hypothetical protein